MKSGTIGHIVGSRRPGVVSNAQMGLLRLPRKFLIVPPLIICSLLFLTLVASQTEQYVFRRRAELLLSQVQSLGLRKTEWRDAKVRFEGWGARQAFGNPCDAHSCSLQVTLTEPVFSYVTERNLFVKLDDYFRWRPKLSYDTGPFERAEFALLNAYLRLGGHPAKVTANIGMRDGLVWSKSILLRIETYGHPAYWSGDFRIEFPLLITIQSVPRFEYFDGHPISTQLYLHSNYEIGRPSGCTICVHGWVRFTPYADPADVRRLMQLNLSCLTRWRPCVSQSDVMPVAWDQHLAELSRLTGDQDHPACSHSMLETLGRDSANIVVARIVRSHKTADGLTVSARTLEQLKGDDLKVGETLDMTG